MKPNFLSGKVAIVTGASSGIGRATAFALARHGACVALAARRQDALVKAEEEITRQGNTAIAVQTDVIESDQVENMVQTVLERFLKIDLLISNAGDYIRAPVIGLERAVIQKSFDINFFGNFNCISAVLPHMLRQKSGHIVVVSSMDGKLGVPMDAPYVSAKFAITGFCEVLRQELRQTGISVTTVLPGRVDTPMISNLKVPRISAKISPEKVASTIIKAIKQKKPVYITPPGAALLYYINVFLPTLSDRITQYFHLEGKEIN
jgi:NAD(P)-dependent dehydrogenase (short-subunit alcohol dehydrogenase family)